MLISTGTTLQYVVHAVIPTTRHASVGSLLLVLRARFFFFFPSAAICVPLSIHPLCPISLLVVFNRDRTQSCSVPRRMVDSSSRRTRWPTWKSGRCRTSPGGTSSSMRLTGELVPRARYRSGGMVYSYFFIFPHPCHTLGF